MIKLSITRVNRDKGHIFERKLSTLYDEEKTSLFISLSRQFGRCCSKMYTGDEKPVGWVFEKKEPYDDKGSFIQETWVELIP